MTTNPILHSLKVVGFIGGVMVSFMMIVFYFGLAAVHERQITHMEPAGTLEGVPFSDGFKSTLVLLDGRHVMVRGVITIWKPGEEVQHPARPVNGSMETDSKTWCLIGSGNCYAQL